EWDPESRLGSCARPSGASPGSIPGDRLNLSDFLSAMRTSSRNWDPIGLNDPFARPQPLEMLICNSAIGNSNWGNWDPQFQFGQLANWQFNQIQFGNSLIGFAEEAEIDEAVMRPAFLVWGGGADAGARRITAVVPYLSYACKFLNRTPQLAIGGTLPACVL